MARTIVGTRIRERRRQVGLNQSELARRIGISPSYLNLIEKNKRGIAGPLLRRTADALGVGMEELDGAAERRLADTLVEIAYLPDLANLGIEADSAGELIGRYPAWARALAVLARGQAEANATARALSDRLTHDPFLGETVHRMLSRISAIRSASEILTDYSDITEVQRDRFDTIIHQESRSLSEVGEALAAYFDRIGESDRSLTPQDEVEALFDARGNHFDEIETEAGDLQGVVAGGDPAERLKMARDIAGKRLAPVIGGIVNGARSIETAAAAARARQALREYAASAILAPLPRFVTLAAHERYDAEVLAARLAMPFEAICRRLATLRAGTGPAFGYVTANAAGTITEMMGLPELAVPRYASACPLWILYRAQQAPETVMRQGVAFPTGQRFVLVGRARATGEAGYGRPRHYVTDMLAMTWRDAGSTVYAPSEGEEAEEVGSACRMCPRRACRHRVGDPLSG